MVNTHETDQRVDSPEVSSETPEPSNAAKAYMDGAYQEAMAIDRTEKELRDEAKDKLAFEMFNTLYRHGIGEETEVTSPHTGKTYIKTARTTPIARFPIRDDLVIGVRLREKLAVIQKFEEGLYVGEEPEVGTIHLIEHDLETREQIGRNSAGVLGAKFVTNSAKGSATRQQIEGMIDTVKYMDRDLSRQQAAGVVDTGSEAVSEPHQ